MKSWIALALLIAGALAASGVRADSMRCGSKLVTDEETLEQVRAKCGEASDIQHSSIWRVPVVWIHGRPFHVGNDLVEVPVQLWTYNFGPRKFMRRIRFEDGLVVEIDTLDYGYLAK
jgi:hypothetical protein